MKEQIEKVIERMLSSWEMDSDIVFYNDRLRPKDYAKCIAEAIAERMLGEEEIKGIIKGAREYYKEFDDFVKTEDELIAQAIITAREKKMRG